MIENFKGKENTNGFDQRPEDRTKGGRKKRLFQQVKGKGYSKDDVRACYASLADFTKEELETLISNKEATALEVAIGQAYLNAMKKGQYRLIKDIIELFADSPRQETISTLNVKELSREEIERQLAELEKLDEV